MTSPVTDKLVSLFGTTTEYTKMLETISRDEFVLCYGPYIIMHRDEFNEYLPMLQSHNSAFTAFLNVYYIMNTTDTHYTLKELKDLCLKMLRTTETKTILNPITTINGQILLQNLHDFKYNKRVFESAMIDAAPIIPYEGVVVQPPHLVTKLSVENDGVDCPNYFKSVLLKYPTHEELKRYVLDLLTHHLFPIMTNTHMTLCDNGNDGFAIDVDKVMGPFDNKTVYSAAYYFFAYVLYQNMDLTKVSAYLSDYSNITTSIGTESFDIEKAINFLSADQIPSDQYTLLALENWENMSAEMERRIEDAVSSTDPTDETAGRFDTQDLLAFFYSNRIYKIDKFTNSAFLSVNPTVSVYSLCDDILICQYENKYLLMPVIDLADNQSRKVVWMDLDGEISVTKGLDTRLDQGESE